MLVHVYHDGMGGVAQRFRHYLEINPSEQAKGRIRMAQPMKGHMGQIVRPDQPGERLGDFLGYEWQTVRSDKDVRVTISRETMLHLSAPDAVQVFDGFGCQCNRPPGFLSLGFG